MLAHKLLQSLEKEIDNKRLIRNVSQHFCHQFCHHFVFDHFCDAQKSNNRACSTFLYKYNSINFKWNRGWTRNGVSRNRRVN